MKVIFSFSILVLSFIFSTQLVHAQADAISVDMIPKSPAPFETVTISVQDFSRDLNQGETVWTVNGKVEDRGVGLTTHRVKVGGLGSVTTVSVNMAGIVRSFTIRPSVTDLVWQADTYTPPFYMGKALHSNQDPITVVAEPYFITPQGSRLDPDKLVYKWTVNGTFNGNASGYGKRIFHIVPSILMKPSDVQVEVSSTDSLYSSTRETEIADTKPETLLYENHPLYGILFNNALNTKDLVMKNDEVSILAEPFYFSNTQKKSGALEYGWLLNDTATDQTGSELTFRKPENGQGRSSVDINIKNPDRFMQFASDNFYVQFDSTTNTGSSPTVF